MAKLTEPFSKQLNGRVAEAVYEAFVKEAQEKRVSIGTVVRWALEDYAETLHET